MKFDSKDQVLFYILLLIIILSEIDFVLSHLKCLNVQTLGVRAQPNILHPYRHGGASQV